MLLTASGMSTQVSLSIAHNPALQHETLILYNFQTAGKEEVLPDPIVADFNTWRIF